LGAELIPDSSALIVLLDPAQQAAAERIPGKAGGKLVAGGLTPDLAGPIDRDTPPYRQAVG
jgi:hypothetical protein